MCGFVAVVDTSRRLTTELLVDLRDALVHRGPDEEGIWLADDRRMGFGHRRLSIIDLAAGQQPMSNGHGTAVIAYNGEVYNHRALRAELERSGHRFRTRCDTEVVLACYEQYGDDCLERLDGMFAFAIWDAVRQRLFFARDRAGEKPLYYTPTRSGWVLGSEIKALLRHPDVRTSVDEEALGYYLSFLTTPPPSTLFRGVSKLPAAHCGSWTAEQGLRTWRWWSLPSRESSLEISEYEAADELRALFEASVAERMMSDVPIGVYLSGGVDSTANVAFMCRHSSEPLQTFSVAFAGEPRLNELTEAREMAEHFGTKHREIVLEDADVVRCIPDLVHHQDEPLADPVCVPLFHLARLTKESGVTVVQVGEGSDESFFGYQGYTEVLLRARTLRRLRAILPDRLLRAGVAATRSWMSDRRHEFMLEALDRGVPAPHGVMGLSERDKDRLLVTRNGRLSAFDFLAGRFGSARTDVDIARVALAHEFDLRLPELLLMRIDKMTMASSVEARAPYLDPQLVEFAARLPFSLHWDDGEGKRILKKAFRDVVPEAVLTRKKRGFGAPVWRWSSTLRAIAEDELMRDPIFEYLDHRALPELIDSSEGHGFDFWVLLNFALWHRHWIEGEDLRESWGLPAAHGPAGSVGPEHTGAHL
jgi:asparagine synthase (glutamine-hydrolysing)